MSGTPRIGLKDEGILIRDVLREADTSVITQKRYIQFDKNNLLEYKSKFDDLKANSILNQTCEFDQNLWSGFALDWNKYFDFTEFEYNQSLYNALKCFVIVQLYDRRLSVTWVAIQLVEVKRVIKMTNSYDAQYMGTFLEYVVLKPKASLVQLKFGNTSFLYFYPLHDYEDYLIELSYIPAFKRIDEGVRELPPYKSIVWFDYVINDFIQSADVVLKTKFYPIYLWWRITTVIPMRPNEFIKLKRDCCFYNDSENQYYIRIPRTKRPPNPLSKRRVVPVIDELKTTGDIYNLITDYVQLSGIGDEEYLFPPRILGIASQAHFESRVVKERIHSNNFRDLINDFYRDIVQDRYLFRVFENDDEDVSIDEHNDSKIIKFRPGDTRHLAFCSMMLQGFNPLTIAQMGGHESLDAQNHYLGHLDEFTDAHALMLAKYIKSNMNKRQESIDDLFTSQEKRKLAFRRFDSEPRKIDGGLCYSRNFPKDCVDKDCIFCNYFRLEFDSLTYSELNILNESLRSVKEEIGVKLGFIKRYYQEMVKERRNKSDTALVNEGNEAQLQRESKALNVLVNREATIIAYIEKINELKDGTIGE